jgi:NACalpha-BTF3-like transcription factor
MFGVDGDGTGASVDFEPMDFELLRSRGTPESSIGETLREPRAVVDFSVKTRKIHTKSNHSSRVHKKQLECVSSLLKVTPGISGSAVFVDCRRWVFSPKIDSPAVFGKFSGTPFVRRLRARRKVGRAPGTQARHARLLVRSSETDQTRVNRSVARRDLRSTEEGQTVPGVRGERAAETEVKRDETHTMARQNDVKTLAAITGQPHEDVVAMLKQYDGDVNAATNALMDSACPRDARFPE